MSKQCQSCGMPLQNKNGDYRASEQNGTKSEKWCVLCYKDGAFIQPDQTLNDMDQVVETALKEKGWPKPLRWLARKQLPKLERWTRHVTS